MSRTWTIVLLSAIGWLCMKQGAIHQWWRLTAFGIVLLSAALGIIVGRWQPSQRLRDHGRAIVLAGFIRRIFRRLF